MANNYILETERLYLRRFEATEQDATFLLELYNTDDWKKYIGDRNVHTIHDALEAITTKHFPNYEKQGYGFFVLVLKATDTCIGTAGVLHRHTLELPDFGYALLPQYYKKGYAYEISKAIHEYCKNELAIEEILAIINTDNAPSIALAEKLGMKCIETTTFEMEDVPVYKYYKKL